MKTLVSILLALHNAKVEIRLNDQPWSIRFKGSLHYTLTSLKPCSLKILTE